MPIETPAPSYDTRSIVHLFTKFPGEVVSELETFAKPRTQIEDNITQLNVRKSFSRPDQEVVVTIELN